MEYQDSSAGHRSVPLLPVIQGGMGIAVSDWRLARAVSSQGQLGVVSATALHIVFARRLGDGDPSGDMRRALNAFPDQEMAQRVFERWFVSEHAFRGAPYRQVPIMSAHPTAALEELNVVATFCEVFSAKQGHDGPVGINLLTKVQTTTLSSLYGAMLAGVDVVIMGAGVPAQIPRVLDDLASGKVAQLKLDVQSDGISDIRMTFDPRSYGAPPLVRPAFLAIVSSVALANYLARDDSIRPDGFVVEKHDAGGHNAPPRSRNEHGALTYGAKDGIDLSRIATLDLPFWLAGGQATAGALERAQRDGAAGVQLGTVFALCEESGLRRDIKDQIIDRLVNEEGLEVRTDMRASSSGYPFKVAVLPGTLGDEQVHAHRERVCDLGLLRDAYEREDGKIGYRCSAEPVVRFVRKGGDSSQTEGRMCLCNGLMAAVGLAQIHNGEVEPPLVTLGENTAELCQLVEYFGRRFTAADVIRLITAGDLLALQDEQSGGPPSGNLPAPAL